MSNGCGRRLDPEPLAGDDLEDVARLDVLLAVADDLLVLLAGEVRLGVEVERAVGVDVAERQLGAGRGEAVDQLVDPVAGVVVGGAGVDRRGRRGRGRRRARSCGCGRRSPSGRRGRTRGRAGRGRRGGSRAGARCSGRRRTPRNRPRRRRTGGGRAGGRRGSRSIRASRSRNGSAEVECVAAPGSWPGVTVTALPRASNRRNGSVPRKLNRPTFSPPMTLSNRNDGADRSTLRKAETGVRPSPVSWR